MKIRIGSNEYNARLRFVQRTQTWVISIGAVLISHEGFRRLDAAVAPGNDIEARRLIEAGFTAAPAMAKAS